MQLIQLLPKQTDSMPDDKLTLAYKRLYNLICLAETKPLDPDAVLKINERIQELNNSDKINGALFRLVKLSENEIINIIKSSVELVPEGYYSKKWSMLGMAAMGIPFGVAIGSITGNMGLLAVGLPIGLGIGALIGRNKDAKALALGKQYAL